MSLRDPAERTATGARVRGEIAGPAPEPVSPYQASIRDFLFAEIWTRPGLDLRSRFLIAIAGAANVPDPVWTERYVHGALTGKHLTLAELREAALHVAVYAGWSIGGVVDAAIDAVAVTLGLAAEPFAPIRAEPWDPVERTAIGGASFTENMLFPSPAPNTAYTAGGILNFVFGEMWNRPGLDQRSRRWLTLVGVGNSCAKTPIGSHVWSAMASGNATHEEMQEFVLQYAVHAGWPKASVMDAAVREQAPRATQGLPFQF